MAHAPENMQEAERRRGAGEGGWLGTDEASLARGPLPNLPHGGPQGLGTPALHQI